MTQEQLDALLAYIDARIDERLSKNSCGPQVMDHRTGVVSEPTDEDRYGSHGQG